MRKLLSDEALVPHILDNGWTPTDSLPLKERGPAPACQILSCNHCEKDDTYLYYICASVCVCVYLNKKE